jgi:3-methyladenine DNA glycosylase AlkC
LRAIHQVILPFVLFSLVWKMIVFYLRGNFINMIYKNLKLSDEKYLQKSYKNILHELERTSKKSEKVIELINHFKNLIQNENKRNS